MTKRKVKEEIKKPDIVLRAVAFILDWAKTNTKACVIGLIVVVVICSSLFGYSFYAKRQNDKVQFMLSQAIQTFGESTVSKILDMVENASSKKSRSENFISKFAKYYTPAVCYGALALAILPPLVRLLFLGQDTQLITVVQI